MALSAMPVETYAQLLAGTGALTTDADAIAAVNAGAPLCTGATGTGARQTGSPINGDHAQQAISECVVCVCVCLCMNIYVYIYIYIYR